MDLDIAINEMQMKCIPIGIMSYKKSYSKIGRKKELMTIAGRAYCGNGADDRGVTTKNREIIGCAIVPLSQVEYEQHFHMKQDERGRSYCHAICVMK